MFRIFLLITYLSVWGSWGVSGFPEEGKWHCILDEARTGLSIPKSLFAGSQIFIETTRSSLEFLDQLITQCQLSCHTQVFMAFLNFIASKKTAIISYKVICKADNPDSKVKIDWFVTESTCWNNRSFLENSDRFLDPSNIRDNKTVGQGVTTNCIGHIMLNEIRVFGGKGPPLKPSDKLAPPGGSPSLLETDNGAVFQNLKKTSHPKQDTSSPVFVIPKDGLYTLILKMRGTNFKADVQVEMMGENGYLSAADWPLLPFYGVMCLVYVAFGLVWLIVSFCQWRELLRIQFWIGGVILLGMLEKATFYAEYQNINTTGVNVRAAVLLAEWVSCAKRTLARMLVIIVSLGFGIVKPRLGSMLHRLVGVGACYFILAVVESYIRVMHPKNDPSNQLLIASIPLAVLDSAICWWIFTALIQTTRTLRLRRNLVKLNLYRHFTNTLIFAVLASVVFMLYSIKVHHLAMCVTDWKDLWVDEAYWHVLFSVLLLVIMILWRPTNNNQRYAFTPLLDAAEDDEEEDQFVNDAYGVKMRSHSRPTSPKPKPTNDDDVLKWVDENIPSAGVETALPIFDSEEEILTTKYEMSKMQ